MLTSVVASEYPGLKEEFEPMNEKQKEPGFAPKQRTSVIDTES
jgi:hypothetical protein